MSHYRGDYSDDSLTYNMARPRCLMFACEYMRSIGIPDAYWDVLKWDENRKDAGIELVIFNNADADKYEFIFELHGGIEALNKAISKLTMNWISTMGRK